MLRQTFRLPEDITVPTFRRILEALGVEWQNPTPPHHTCHCHQSKDIIYLFYFLWCESNPEPDAFTAACLCPYASTGLVNNNKSPYPTLGCHIDIIDLQ